MKQQQEFSWPKMVPGELSVIATLVLAALSLSALTAIDSSAKAWVAGVATTYSLGALSLAVAIVLNREEFGQNWYLYLLPGCVSPLFVCWKINRKIYLISALSRFFFCAVPSFTLAVHCTQVASSNTFLALLILTSLSLCLFGLGLLMVLVGALVACVAFTWLGREKDQTNQTLQTMESQAQPYVANN